MTRLLAAVSLFSLCLASLPAQSADINLTMNQWVESTPDGGLTGRIIGSDAGLGPVPLAEVDVAIVAEDGNVLSAKTNTDGIFTIPGVRRGVYTLIARGQDVFACEAMHVIHGKDNANDRFPKTAEIYAANVDFPTVNMAMIRYLPPKLLTDGVSINDADLAELSKRMAGGSSYQIARRNGGMKGRIHLAGTALEGAPGTNVFILQDGIELTRAITDVSGNFFVELEAGNYSLLAVGAGGVGLLGFELVDVIDNSTAQLDGASRRFVVAQNASNVGEEFAMQVAPTPEVIDAVEESFVQLDNSNDDVAGAPVDGAPMEFGTPVPGAGFRGGGGFGGGGGGGGGFGGGFGGIAAMAGMVGVAAAVSNDNDRGVIIASPASP